MSVLMLPITALGALSCSEAMGCKHTLCSPGDRICSQPVLVDAADQWPSNPAVGYERDASQLI
jgi:hypothetical protein